jgi:extradiol dioxygenase family protein
MTRSRFHLAFHVTDLNAARAFYGDILGCAEGRSTESWVDFDFFGHQISLHLGEPFPVANTGKVGEHMVPMPHLGIILPKAEWDALAQKLKDAQTVFVIEPTTRFAGEPGEQSIMFFTDPSGNPIEVKGFKDFDGIFAS